MKYAQQFSNLISKGLYEENIEELIELCKQEMKESEHPFLPFIFLSIFNSISNLWDNQNIPKEDYEKLNSTLSGSLLSVIAASSNYPGVDLIAEIDSLVNNYMKLQLKFPQH